MMRSTGTSERPIESSYEIICAEERTPPKNGYFEFEDHPAMTMPYTEIDVIANT